MPIPEKILPFIRCTGAGYSDNGENVTFSLEIPGGQHFAFKGDYLAATGLLLELMKAIAATEELRKATIPPAPLNPVTVVAFTPNAFRVHKLLDPLGWTIWMEMEGGFPLPLLLDEQRFYELLEALSEVRPTTTN